MKFLLQRIRFALIIGLAVCALCAACGSFGARQLRKPSVAEVKRQGAEAPTPPVEQRAPYAPPVSPGQFDDDAIKESSGVVASRANAGLYWTHNDSGDGPFLYAFDREGRKRGVWRVAGAQADDWEDIAAGPGPERGRAYLYIGDIGDNEMARGHITVYRAPEPRIAEGDSASSKKEPRLTETAEAINLKYPDGSHDAETLLVHPLTGDIYIVVKSLDPAAGVYKLAAPFSAGETRTLARVGEMRAPTGVFSGLFTGGDISPDGARVVLCDYVNGYELSAPAGADFDSVWRQAPLVVLLGARKQGEAICYGADGASIMATSEGRRAALVEVRRAAQNGK